MGGFSLPRNLWESPMGAALPLLDPHAEGQEHRRVCAVVRCLSVTMRGPRRHACTHAHTGLYAHPAPATSPFSGFHLTPWNHRKSC